MDLSFYGLLIGTPGTVELGVIALIIFFLFGAKKIPDFARSLGEAKTEFQKGLESVEKQAESETETADDGQDRSVPAENGSASQPRDLRS